MQKWVQLWHWVILLNYCLNVSLGVFFPSYFTFEFDANILRIFPLNSSKYISFGSFRWFYSENFSFHHSVNFINIFPSWKCRDSIDKEGQKQWFHALLGIKVAIPSQNWIWIFFRSSKIVTMNSIFTYQRCNILCIHKNETEPKSMLRFCGFIFHDSLLLGPFCATAFIPSDAYILKLNHNHLIQFFSL